MKHMKQPSDRDIPLVTERDIDEKFGLFVEGSYPDSVPIPDSVKREKPDGSDTSHRGNETSSG
ncbi:hypothetical protein [Paenibacillus ihbetae]|nr:hypothetical protein [Paenibacillus ihbetae]